MNLERMALAVTPFTTVQGYRASLRSLRRWCDRTGRNPAELYDDDLAEWATTSRSSAAAVKIALAAVTAAYRLQGWPSPVGPRTEQVCRQLAAPARKRRRNKPTQRLAA